MPLVDVNDAFCRIYGYSSARELLGRTSLELGRLWLSAGERERLLTLLQQQGRVQQFDAQLRRKTGANRLPPHFRGFDPSSMVKQHYAGPPNRHYRAQVPIEELLQQSEQRLKTILDTIPDPAWLKDKEGRFLAVNAAWCSFCSA